MNNQELTDEINRVLLEEITVLTENEKSLFLLGTPFDVKAADTCDLMEDFLYLIFRSSLEGNYNSPDYKAGALIYFRGNLIGMLKISGEKSFYCFKEYKSKGSSLNVQRKYVYWIPERLFNIIIQKYNEKKSKMSRQWLRVNINNRLYFMQPSDNRHVKSTHNNVLRSGDDVYHKEKDFMGEYDININDLYDFILNT